MIWFTSDWHLGHYNIIGHCERPFTTVDEMNNTIIANYKALVKPNDTVYFLGDFAWKPLLIPEILPTLPGLKTIILGNHDRHYRKQLKVWCATHNLLEIKIDGRPITLCHYPMHAWNKSHLNAWHLHGHCHGTLVSVPTIKRLDVGVDAHGFHPISWETVKARLEC